MNLIHSRNITEMFQKPEFRGWALVFKHIMMAGIISEKSSEQNSKAKTLEMVKAGLHCSFKMSRQMLPLLLILG